MLACNLLFEDIAQQLGVPFVMKDNFGGRGTNVFLVEDKNSFEQIKTNNPTIKFICQEFIKSSKGRDLRCYVVGEKIFAITRHTSDENEFRANISQGGYSQKFELTQEQAQCVLAIKNKLGLEIGSVDFLFDQNNNLIFCEANGNTAFKSYTKLGIDLRMEFATYIKEKYLNYKNFVQQKKDLSKKQTSFEILKGQNKVMLSAPHNVEQIRKLEKKPLDLSTGHLLLNVANHTKCHAIIKTNCVGQIGKTNDDANYDDNHPYKIELSNYIKNNKIKFLLDIHSMAENRPEQINFGIFGGQNIQNNFEVLKNIEKIFNNHGFAVSIDTPFNAGEKTISNYIAKFNNIFCLQIEIQSKLIYRKNHLNQFDKMSKTFFEVVEYLNSIC